MGQVLPYLMQYAAWMDAALLTAPVPNYHSPIGPSQDKQRPAEQRHENSNQSSKVRQDTAREDEGRQEDGNRQGVQKRGTSRGQGDGRSSEPARGRRLTQQAAPLRGLDNTAGIQSGTSVGLAVSAVVSQTAADISAVAPPQPLPATARLQEAATAMQAAAAVAAPQLSALAVQFRMLSASLPAPMLPDAVQMLGIMQRSPLGSSIVRMQAGLVSVKSALREYLTSSSDGSTAGMGNTENGGVEGSAGSLSYGVLYSGAQSLAGAVQRAASEAAALAEELGGLQQAQTARAYQVGIASKGVSALHEGWYIKAASMAAAIGLLR